MLPLSLLLIPTLREQYPVYPLNNPQWSLALEIAANVLHAFVLARLPTRRLSALVGVSGIGLAVAIALTGRNTLGSTGDNFSLGLVRVLFCYGSGLVVARLWLANALPSWVRWRWSCAVLVPLALIITLPFWPVSDGVGDILVTLFMLPACFAFTVRAELPRRLESLFAGLGLLSYPLYAIHLPILTIVSLTLPRSWGSFVGPATALVAAAAIARLFERRRGRPAADAIDSAIPTLQA